MGLMRGGVFNEQIPHITQAGRAGFRIESGMTGITQIVKPSAILGVASFVLFNNCSDITKNPRFPMKALSHLVPAQIRPLNFYPVFRSHHVGSVVEDKIGLFEILT